MRRQEIETHRDRERHTCMYNICRYIEQKNKEIKLLWIHEYIK